MVDLPEDTVFRNVFESSANRIAMYLQTEDRFGFSQSYDYSDPSKMVVTCREVRGGRPMVFILTLTKRDATYVDRELPRAVTAYDRGA